MADDSYSAAINKNAPRNGADLLRARIANGKLTNERLADWLKDYSQLQRRHASELERFLAKHVVNEENLGTLAEPWQKVAYLVTEQCRLSSDLAKRVQVESERPIREQAYGSRAERALNSLTTGSVPSTEAIDQIQKFDELRLENIKNSLARLATIEVDRSQSQVNCAESAMQAWLVYEPKDDISSYVAQIVSGVAPSTPAVDSSSHNRDHQLRHSHSGQPTSRNTSQASQSTVRRRTSLLLMGGSRRDESGSAKSPGSNLRSKVGSIFGLKKKDRHQSSPTRTPTGSIDGGISNPVTRPPDFGPRQHSQLSARSGASSPTSSLRNLRIRDAHEDGLYAPSSPSPRRSQAPPPVSTTTANAPANQQSAAPIFGAPTQVTNGTNGSDSVIAPLTPTKARPGSRNNSITQQRPPSPLRSQSPLHQSSGSDGGIQAAPVAAGVPPDYSQPQPQFGAPVSAGAAPEQLGGAPAPPPARSIHRQGSLNRHPSNGSNPRQQRSGSLQRENRDARVGSQVFSSLPPASDSNRNSMVYPQGPETGSDRLGPLPPIPATPQTFATPGSPEQFWTPAARFPTQFPPFDMANSSVASLNSSRPPALPPLPSGDGLVAAAVEHIQAEYEGDQLVRSSIRGEAIAQVSGGANDQETLVLGVLLADPNSKLTLSPLLHQTSSLSFDLPTAVYSVPQELVQYTTESAVGRVPVKLTPIWRFDAGTVRLVLSYQLSDLYVGGDEVEVHDLAISVSIRGAARAHAAQSKPVATFSREKQRVTWRFNQPQILRRGQPAAKLLCQFVTDGQASEPGHIDLKARLPVVANSVLQLRTLSAQGEWVSVPTTVANDVQSTFLDAAHTGTLSDSHASSASPLASPQTATVHTSSPLASPTEHRNAENAHNVA